MLRFIQSTPRMFKSVCRHSSVKVLSKDKCIEHRYDKSESDSLTAASEYEIKDELYMKTRQVWLENLNTISEKRIGIVSLCSEIFGAQPRIDVLHQNVVWQRLYRFVSYANTKVRSEVRGGGRKPWPQKGMGKARHGSIRSPLWRKGGIAHGPCSPTTYFYMLPFYIRIMGLISTLSVKLAQDDLHLVSDLEIPSDDSSYLQDLIKERNWGPSVLFVDKNDTMPLNIAVASNSMKHVNLMPVFGLNVYSMLKHDSLILTESSARLIEEKLIYHLNRIDSKVVCRKFKN